MPGRMQEQTQDLNQLRKVRREKLAGDLDYVKDVLHDGNRRANEIAHQTLNEVREAMGMVY